MTIFYRGRCVRITHEVFEAWCPSHQLFALRDLRGLGVVEFPVDPPTAVNSARNGSAGIAGATAIVFALGWVEGWQVLDAPEVSLPLLLLLIASLVVSGACWRARAVERVLMATYHDQTVTLYRSPDPQTFEQVKRGLMRALERLDDTR